MSKFIRLARGLKNIYALKYNQFCLNSGYHLIKFSFVIENRNLDIQFIES
jgi:hypothetical protein